MSDDLMPCGHPTTAVVEITDVAGATTQRCGRCAAQAALFEVDRLVAETAAATPNLPDEPEFDVDIEPPYGQPWSPENPAVMPRYELEGAATLAEVAERLRRMAKICDELADKGWALAGPVQNGYVETKWAGDGPPPPKAESHPEDSA